MDSLSYEGSSSEGARDGVTSRRRLSDGREFTIIKIFYEPDDLTRRLETIGWWADLRGTSHHFLYGSAAPAEPA